MIINSGYFASVPDEFYSYPELATDAEKQAIRESFTECIMLSRRFITFFASSSFFIRYKTGEIEAMKPGYTSADISSLLEKGYEHLFIIAIPGTVQVTLTYLDIKELQSNFDFSTSKIAEGTSEIVPYLPALIDVLQQTSENSWINDTAMKSALENQTYYLQKLVDINTPDRIIEQTFDINSTNTEAGRLYRKSIGALLNDWCYKSVNTIPKLITQVNFGAAIAEVYSDEWWNSLETTYTNGLVPSGFGLFVKDKNLELNEHAVSGIKITISKSNNHVLFRYNIYLVGKYSTVEIGDYFNPSTGEFESSLTRAYLTDSSDHSVPVQLVLFRD